MHHTFLVVTLKKWLKSVYTYGSYRKINTGLSLFGPPCRYAAATSSLSTDISLAVDSVSNWMRSNRLH